MIRVLLVDDQALVRAGFRLLLETQPDIEVVAECAEGASAVEQAVALAPDLVVMDLHMPAMDGIEATRRILSARPESRVLVLTTFDLDEYLYDAVCAGASGFLLKDVPPEQLVAGVRMVASGDALLAPALTRRLVERFVLAPLPGRLPEEASRLLTARELEVLRLVGRGLSNAEIAAELFLSEATVKTHVGRLLAKLHLRDRVQVVVYAYENGVVVAGSADRVTRD